MSRTRTNQPDAEKVDAAPSGRRRYPADQRRARMLEQAGGYFARHGFDVSTRDLAGALGVTQGLIYKYFASKEALIEETLESALGNSGKTPSFEANKPVAEAIAGFYRTFVAGATETRMRLFIRAGLDGRSWPTRRGAALTQNVFLPMIAGLRREAGLPGLADNPAMRGERELVMMLHAAMVFLGIRRHVYGMPMPDSLDDVVDLYVRTFTAGAVPSIRNLHENGDDSLTVRLLTAVPDDQADAAIAPGRKRPSSK